MSKMTGEPERNLRRQGLQELNAPARVNLLLTSRSWHADGGRVMTATNCPNANDSRRCFRHVVDGDEASEKRISLPEACYAVMTDHLR